MKILRFGYRPEILLLLSNIRYANKSEFSLRLEILGLLLCGLLSTSAQAESRVTLYGSIDLGVDLASNVGASHQFRMANAVGTSTMWGLLGHEELGGGYATVFRVESGFNAANGDAGGGLAFSRQAYVGLLSDRFGTLTIGRQWSPMTDLISPLSLNGVYGGWYSAHPNDLDNLNYTFSIPNAVKYVSQNIDGVSVEIMYAFGGQPGQFSANAVFSGALSWRHGGFTIGVGYLQINDPQTTVIGYQSVGGYVNTVYGADLAQARSQRIAGIGASYSYGPVQVFGNLTQVDFPQRFSSLNTRFRNAELSVAYRINPAAIAYGGFTDTEGHAPLTSKKTHYRQINLGVDYSLSKRTSVYADAVLQSAGGGVPAQIAGLDAASNSHQAIGHVGVKHLF
ncbi:porin [Paraburkholderia tropica]|uniref:porin n=1 Tax=Paraburkholderia tropica TaxID=92647 RepID=UPI00159092E8|nr:porin [Paraburkholderia tropica]